MMIILDWICELRIIDWIKQQFCNHVWKTEKTETLGHYGFKCALQFNWETYAVYQRCIKCGATQIVEERGKTKFSSRDELR